MAPRLQRSARLWAALAGEPEDAALGPRAFRSGTRPPAGQAMGDRHSSGRLRFGSFPGVAGRFVAGRAASFPGSVQPVGVIVTVPTMP
jgi:hypothetical protein